MTMFVQQKTPHDCAICTIAMATGADYDRVLQIGIDGKHFDPKGGCRSEYGILEKLGFKQMDSFRVLHRGILAPEFFIHFAWARRAILAVPSLNISGGWHSIYFDGVKIFDPNAGREDKKSYCDIAWRDLRPNEIILFADPQI